ncbi:MAG: DUF1640 domain-containing protein [Deltaproteobacteria bacterium]|nr:DUF1640 domain-containing protein [Deltaproteobacteria bacterium]
MENIVYDTLAYVKKLKKAGFTDEQAEVQAEEIARVLNDHIATKTDLEKALKELEYKLKYQIITAVGGMLVGAVIIIGVLIKILR